MRASVLVLGPLLARYGRAKVSLPGGCAIGARPIDQHLKGLEAMGATITLEHGYVARRVPAAARRRRSYLDMATVTGTENLMMAAALAKGRTHARERRARARGRGARARAQQDGRAVDGAGTDVIHIEGVDELHRSTTRSSPTASRPAPSWPPRRPPRRRAGRGRRARARRAPVAKLRAAGVEIVREGTGMRVRSAAGAPLRAVDITTRRTRASPPTCRRSSWC
jgi:UDP-N-acetylglucosamine 1-carboxyvinyltransferase